MEKREIETTLKTLIKLKALEEKTSFEFEDLEIMDLSVVCIDSIIKDNHFTIEVSWVKEIIDTGRTFGDGYTEPIEKEEKEVIDSHKFFIPNDIESLEVFKWLVAECEDIIDLIHFSK